MLLYSPSIYPIMGFHIKSQFFLSTNHLHISLHFLSCCLAAPSLTSFVRFIHYLSSSHFNRVSVPPTGLFWLVLMKILTSCLYSHVFVPFYSSTLTHILVVGALTVFIPVALTAAPWLCCLHRNTETEPPWFQTSHLRLPARPCWYRRIMCLNITAAATK